MPELYKCPKCESTLISTAGACSNCDLPPIAYVVSTPEGFMEVVPAAYAIIAPRDDALIEAGDALIAAMADPAKWAEAVDKWNLAKAESAKQGWLTVN